MGDSANNTRLKSLDEAVENLQEQSVAHSKFLEEHSKSFETVNVALKDIATQLALLCASSSPSPPPPPPPPPTTIPSSYVLVSHPHQHPNHFNTNHSPLKHQILLLPNHLTLTLTHLLFLKTPFTNFAVINLLQLTYQSSMARMLRVGFFMPISILILIASLMSTH